MAQSFDLAEMVARYQERAEAVRNRNLPPVGGDERQAFLRQAEVDAKDFGALAEADASLDDGILTFTTKAPDATTSFDPTAIVTRFRERAAAVRKRKPPLVAGPERDSFMRQAEADFMDFAMLGDAEFALADGVMTLKVDLRPKS